MTHSWQTHERWLQERQRESAARRSRHQHAAVRDRLMMGPPALLDVVRRVMGRPPRLGRLYGYEKGLAASVNRAVEAAVGYGADPYAAWRHKAGVLRARLQEQPNEWAYHYLLCFTALELAELAEALEAATHMQALRPTDPRSPNALGTVYAFIATVASVNDDELFNLLLNLPASFTTESCAKLMAGLGLTVESAAQQAHQWFQRTLEAGLHPQDRQALEWSMATVRRWLAEDAAD